MISVHLIQAVVADTFDVTVEEMLSERRSQDVLLPRQVAIYLARELTPLSLPNLGRHFGGRNHQTIISSIRRVRARALEKPFLGEIVERLRSTLMVSVR